MTVSVLADAADRLGTDRLRVTVRNAWLAATSEASIVHTDVEIDVTRAEPCVVTAARLVRPRGQADG